MWARKQARDFEAILGGQNLEGLNLENGYTGKQAAKK